MTAKDTGNTIKARTWTRRTPGHCPLCGHAIRQGDDVVTERWTDWKGNTAKRKHYHADCWDDEMASVVLELVVGA